MKCYVVDAFSDKVFGGNPAAVCILQEKWLSEGIMQNMAKEHQLAETAFVLKTNEGYHIRWLTPGGEIDLCGHATLASAFVVMNFIDSTLQEISFESKSGILKVRKIADMYELDFPSIASAKLPLTQELKLQIQEALGFAPLEVYLGRDLICICENEEQVESCVPNLQKVESLQGLLCHISAKGTKYDCVSRTFAPKCDVSEDFVCGSGHCQLVPIWSQKLAKSEIIAFQASSRTGVLYCENQGQRVKLKGKAVLYSINEICEENLAKVL